MLVPQRYGLIVGANGHPFVADPAVDAFIVEFLDIGVSGEGRAAFLVVRSFGATRGD
jgi:hypothetical protein